jgi:hypothetical protein
MEGSGGLEGVMVSLRDLSLKNLTAAGPIVASIFAFSYVVGYFYAFDISWFPFFSLTEHLVFALRAIPVAIAASALFLVSLTIMEEKAQFEFIHRRARLWRMVWAIILIGIVLYATHYNHIGLVLSLLAISLSTFMLSATSVLEIGINLSVICFVVGFASGLVIKNPLYSSVKYSMIIVRKTQTDLNPGPLTTTGSNTAAGSNSRPVSRGHVIFVGEGGVLYYDYGFHDMRWLRRDDIAELCACKSRECASDFSCEPAPASDKSASK